MIKRFDETGASQIMVEPVADVTAYGVVDCKGESLKPGESVPMVGVVEKPKADVAPSNLAVVGRYVLSAIFGRCWRKRLREPVMKFS
jgi:UTP--glucose-1-phosphate uridylyltransferase